MQIILKYHCSTLKRIIFIFLVQMQEKKETRAEARLLKLNENLKSCQSLGWWVDFYILNIDAPYLP